MRDPWCNGRGSGDMVRSHSRSVRGSNKAVDRCHIGPHSSPQSPGSPMGPRNTGWASSASTLSPVLLFVPDLLFTGSRAHADQWWLQAPLHGAALAWACCDSGVTVYWMAVLIRGRVERSTGRKSGVGSGRSFGVGCEAALRPPWTPNRRDGYQSHVLGSRLVFPISFGVEESVEIG